MLQQMFSIPCLHLCFLSKYFHYFFWLYFNFKNCSKWWKTKKRWWKSINYEENGILSKRPKFYIQKSHKNFNFFCYEFALIFFLVIDRILTVFWFKIQEKLFKMMKNKKKSSKSINYEENNILLKRLTFEAYLWNIQNCTYENIFRPSSHWYFLRL